jgi:hypothetical protein
MELNRRLVAGVAVGVGISILLNLVWDWSFRTVMDCCSEAESTPYWYTNVSTVFGALSPLIPGFVAGWISMKRGLLVGFLVGFIATIAYSTALGRYWPEVEWSSAASVSKTFLWLSLHGFATGLISGAAGGAAELLRSNNALERTRDG